jgi:hypothetical protein
LTHGAVGKGFRYSLPLNISERTRSSLVVRFPEVNLLAFKGNVPRSGSVKEIAAQNAANAAHRFIFAQYSSDGQKTETVCTDGDAVILNPVRVLDRDSENLKTAADADDRHVQFA